LVFHTKTAIPQKNKPNLSRRSLERSRIQTQSKPIQTPNEANFGPETRINYENKANQSQF
jgi:hypothetical protein